MKKNLVVLFIVGIFILLLTFSSASFFSNIFDKITGKATTTANPIPVYKLYSSTATDYLYTTDQTEKTNMLSKGYTDQGIFGYVFTTQVSGTVPLYRLYNSQITDHFYATSSTEKTKAINLGFVDQGILGYVYSASGNNRNANYRLWSDSISAHVYTTSETEKNNFVSSGWTFEKIEGYLPVITPACTDSDNGKNHEIKGTVSYNDKSSGISGSVEDSCSGSQLKEYYCSGDSLLTENYVCPNGCSNGACLNATICKMSVGISQTDLVNCIYNGISCQSKYDLNSDGVYTIIGDMPCYVNQTSTCTDSDGLDYYKKGISYDNNLYKDGGMDSCYINSNYDHLVLNEYYCTNGRVEGKTYDCPNGCSDGACINAIIQNNSCISNCNGKQCGTDGCGGTCGTCEGISTHCDSKNQCVQNVRQSTTCTDNNKNYYQKGTASVITIEDGNISFVVAWKNETDYCSGSELVKYFCNGQRNNINYTFYTCPNGCSDGACIQFNQTTTTCTDSDNGLNYYIKGTSSKGQEQLTDFCVNSIKLSEAICNVDNNPANAQYDCPNGCSDGACISSTPLEITDCNNMMNFVKNPKSFNFESEDYELQDYSNYSGVVWDENKQKSYYSNYASWSSNSDNGYRYVSIEMSVFDYSFDIKNWLDQQINWNLCKVDYYYDNDKQNPVYVCNGNALWNSDATPSNYVDTIWASDNKIMRVYTSSYDYNNYDNNQENLKEQKLNDFIDALKGKEQTQYVGWEYFSVDWPLRGIIEQMVNSCGSSIPEDTCSPSWTCKTEPAVCPPHGYQTRTCTDYACDSEPKTTELECTPGICAGCMVPRWFEYSGDSTCIPYGTRFNQQTGWTKKLSEYTSTESLSESMGNGEVGLRVLSSDEAILTVYSDNSKGKNYTLRKNEKVSLDASDFYDEGMESITLTPIEIYYNENDNTQSYINFEAEVKGWENTADEINAYCNYDGKIMQQKTSDQSTGNWAKCQNNYECESNLCSSGECIEVSKMIQELSGWKVLGAKIVCKFAHLFSIENYNDCVGDRLGKAYLENSGSGGGSSSSGSSD